MKNKVVFMLIGLVFLVVRQVYCSNVEEVISLEPSGVKRMIQLRANPLEQVSAMENNELTWSALVPEKQPVERVAPDGHEQGVVISLQEGGDSTTDDGAVRSRHNGPMTSNEMRRLGCQVLCYAVLDYAFIPVRLTYDYVQGLVLWGTCNCCCAYKDKSER